MVNQKEPEIKRHKKNNTVEKILKKPDENPKNSNDQDKDNKIKTQIENFVNSILYSKSFDELNSAILNLKSKIDSAPKSVTSISKPLKFIHEFFDPLQKFFDQFENQSKISLLADILSYVSTIVKENGNCLKYKLKSQNNDISLWGQEYIRHLARDIIDWHKIQKESPSLPAENIDTVNKINDLIKQTIKFCFDHGAWSEAIDLLFEVDKLSELLEILNKAANSHLTRKVCTYLQSCQHFVPPENKRYSRIAEVCFQLHLQQNCFSDAFKVALISKRPDLAMICFKGLPQSQKEDATLRIPSVIERRQLALMASAVNFYIKIEGCEDDIEALESLAGKEQLSRHFILLAKELSLETPKKLDDIFKQNVIDRSTFKKHDHSRSSSQTPLDSSRENLAATMANAFVHAGHGKDFLMASDSDWVFKHKAKGLVSAAAAYGLINLWNLEDGFQVVDAFSKSSDPLVVSGSLLGYGLVGCNVRSPLNASNALLINYLEGDDEKLKFFAAISIGISAFGTCDMDLVELLEPMIGDYSQPQLCAFASLSLGMIFCGTCEDAAVESIFEALLHFSASQISTELIMLISVGLALIFLETGEKSEGIYEALEGLGVSDGEIARALVKSFAYAGSGNVVDFHEILRKIESDTDKNELNIQKDEKNKTNEFVDIKTRSSICVIGLALNAMGEKISRSMSYKIFDDLLRYENNSVRRAVPLALALLFISRPEYSVVQLLGKLSHETDESVSLNAILALGFVAAGTNNSRVAKILRNLAVYYSKNSDHLFVTRISQGLIHCGKGLLTLSPYHFDDRVIDKNALSGILIVLLSSIDIKKSILKDDHYILYYLALALRPRMLMTVNSDLESVQIPVRVGQAADSVRLAGESKTIVGFQTQMTPVLLSAGEKAELATKKYKSMSNNLEGIVIIEENLDDKSDEKNEKPLKK